MTHYHVLVGLQGGYMPATNVYCETWAEAQSVAREYKAQFNDDDPRDPFKGDIGRDGYAANSREYIEIVECQREDCLDQEANDAT